MVPRAQVGKGGWRAAVMVAVAIAVTVGVVGTAVLTITGRSFGTAFSAVLPGVLLGAGASLLLALLGSRRRRLQDELDRMDRDQDPVGR
jgi:hypothetical protein